jgi:hypothetical protein
MGRFDRELAMKLHLPDVTLVMIDTQCHALARLAMADSLRDIAFGDAVIFADEPIAVEGTRFVKVPKWPNIGQCSHFMWYELPDHITTKFAINIQWDSWIVDAGCWSNEFLAYDYVGAPWWYNDALNVGNGCALRSRKLMKFLQQHKDCFPLTISQEDHLISRIYRPTLEQCGSAGRPRLWRRASRWNARGQRKTPGTSCSTTASTSPTCSAANGSPSGSP